MSAYRELLKTLSKSGIILDSMQTEGKLSFSNSLNQSTVLSDLDVTVILASRVFICLWNYISIKLNR